MEELNRLLDLTQQPVILLEGTRKLANEQFGKLVLFGEFIAKKFPHVRFRSGNASGSDDAFAQGVRKVAPDRMQIVLPKLDSGKSRLYSTDYVLALEDVTQAEEKQIIYESKRATPKNKRLFDAYELQHDCSRARRAFTAPAARIRAFTHSGWWCILKPQRPRAKCPRGN